MCVRTIRKHTDDEGLFGLSSVLVVPGRPARRVDGASPRAEQGRLSFTQRGGALSARSAGGGQEPVQRVVSTPTAKHRQTGKLGPEPPLESVQLA